MSGAYKLGHLLSHTQPLTSMWEEHSTVLTIIQSTLLFTELYHCRHYNLPIKSTGLIKEICLPTCFWWAVKLTHINPLVSTEKTGVAQCCTADWVKENKLKKPDNRRHCTWPHLKAGVFKLPLTQENHLVARFLFSQTTFMNFPVWGWVIPWDISFCERSHAWPQSQRGGEYVCTG